MSYSNGDTEYFFIEVDCDECTNGKYTIYNAYDATDVEEVVCEFCEGTGRMLKPVPIMGSEHKKKYLN